MTIAKPTVANVAAEEKAHSNRTHMGTSQHGVDVNAQPEVLDHLREQMSETEFLPHHGVRAREKQEVFEYKHGDGAGCTKGRWTVSDWKKSKGMQSSWMVSVSKWFADEKEDTGLQTAENSRVFRHRVFDQISQQ